MPSSWSRRTPRRGSAAGLPMSVWVRKKKRRDRMPRRSTSNRTTSRPSKASPASAANTARLTRRSIEPPSSPRGLGKEFEHDRDDAVILEIFVTALREAYELLRLRRHCEQSFPDRDWDRLVALTMEEEDRRLYRLNAFVRMELVLHQQAYRHERINRRRDIRGRRVGRLEHEFPNRTLGAERHGNAAAERKTPEHDAIGRVARGGKIVGRHCIAMQPLFGGMSCRSGIAAERQSQQSNAGSSDLAETTGQAREKIAVAVKE